MGLQGPSNPPDGWQCAPATAWGTNFLLDTTYALNGWSSIKVPAYGASGGNTSIQLIGPPIQLNAASDISPVRYNPRAFFLNPVNVATASIRCDFNVYASPNLGGSSAVFNIINGASINFGASNSKWAHRSTLVNALTGGIAYGWGRFVFSLLAGGAADLWIGGVDLQRLPGGTVIQSSATLNVTGGAGFASIPWTNTVMAAEVDIANAGFGASTGIIVKSSGLWSVVVDLSVPANLAAGTVVNCKIIDAASGTNNTLSTYSVAINQPGGGGVAQTMQFAFLVDLVGSNREFGNNTSGYPYVVQISHNDGVNVRNFGTATLRMVHHR